jgi:hypothetical protein
MTDPSWEDVAMTDPKSDQCIDDTRKGELAGRSRHHSGHQPLVPGFLGTLSVATVCENLCGKRDGQGTDLTD